MIGIIIKYAIPMPSSDFADLDDYDILTVKTDLVYGYEDEYTASSATRTETSTEYICTLTGTYGQLHARGGRI